jgi:hypothetical protein
VRPSGKPFGANQTLLMRADGKSNLIYRPILAILN